jgi:hypothetical protein
MTEDQFNEHMRVVGKVIQAVYQLGGEFISFRTNFVEPYLCVNSDGVVKMNKGEAGITAIVVRFRDGTAQMNMSGDYISIKTGDGFSVFRLGISQQGSWFAEESIGGFLEFSENAERLKDSINELVAKL